jgi:RHS repeat-associated protein
MERSAPCLVRLDTQPELEAWLIETCWGNAQVIFFTSTAEVQTLLPHLRSLLDIRAENGRHVFFRFFDPLILGQLLSALSPSEAPCFFGPVQRFACEDDQARPRVFDRPPGKADANMHPSRLVTSKRSLFSVAWNRRLLEAHQQAYERLGFATSVDPAANALTLTDRDGAQATLQKTRDGVAVTTGEGRLFQYGLTACKNPAWIIDPAGRRIDLDIQERENIVHKNKQSLLHAIRMEENRKCWVFDYDERNHLQRIDYPDSTHALAEHDAYGHLRAYTDRNGHPTRFELDAHERLTRQVDANGQATVFDYEDRLAPARITFADGAAFEFKYTDQDTLHTFLANDEQVAEFQVDPESGSWQVRYNDGAHARFEVENGKVVRAENPAGTLVLAYDAQGLLVSETFNNQTVTYQRNASGLLTGIVTPSGRTIRFGRDGEQRVSRIVDWSGRAIGVTYALNGALERIEYPNGVRLQQATAPSGLPVQMQLTHPAADEPIFQRRFFRDRLDRVIQVRDARKSVAYSYDLEGRLLGAQSNHSAFCETFTIDAKANRLADAQARYQINAADRIEQPGFDYDRLGNLVERTVETQDLASLHASTRFQWGENNRLRTVRTPDGTVVRMAYDAFGRRVEKRVNGTRTRTIWAGAQPLQEIVLHPDGDRTIDYLFFPGTPVLLALRDNHQIHYAAFGHRYETLCLTDVDGAVAWQADYDAYGNARIEKGAEIFQPFRLAGHYLDSETGLHYSAARYYDPRLGRYLSMDPLFLEGGGDNFYAYCDGDPINRIDPHGELFFVPILIGMAIGAAIGAGIEYYRQRQAGKGTDGYKIAKAALIGGAIGAIGGGVGAAVEGVIGATTLTGMGGVGFLSGAASSVAEQCAESTLTDKAVSPLEMARQAATDGVIGAGIGLVTFGAGAVFARRAKNAATALAKNAPTEQADEIAHAARKQAAAATPETQAKSRKSTDRGDITTTAEPVNAVSGEVILTQNDFSLPGRITLNWTRHYGSQVQYSGLLGQGWQCPADARLQIEEGLVVFYDGSPGGAVFERLPSDAPVMEAANGSMLSAIPDGYQVRLKSGLCYQFSRDLDRDRSLVTRISDRAGNHLRFVREEGLLTAIQDNGGRTIQIVCEQGRIVQMTFHGRLLARYQYQEGALTAAIDAAGHAKHYTYADGRLTRHRDRNGLSFYYAYDARGRCINSRGDNGLYDYRFAYTPYERCTQVTNSLGHVSQYYHDADRLPIKVVDAGGGVTVYDYDAVGRIIAVTDPLERVTRYDYDAAGNLLEVTRPDDSRMAFVYDDRHRPIQILEPNDKIWRQHFDDHGRLIEKISPLGAVTKYAYNRAGDLAAITDPQGRTTRFEWDPNGLIESVIQPSGERAHYQRDPFGNITAVIDATGAATRYSYDERSRPIVAVSPSGLRQTFEWDPEENLLLHTDAAGRQTRFEYTGVNELARRINADGTSVAYHYDTEEHLTGVTNERGQTHRFAFDPAGRVATQTDYYGQSRSYQYDPAGQLIQSVDPLGCTIAYGYDPAGRMIAKLFASEERETFTWDPTGHLIAFESPDIRVERTFDADGRLILEKSGSFWVQFDHDAAGHRTARTTSHGNRIVYTHDESGMVAAIQINDQAPITFSRDPLGRISAERLSEQLSRTYGYDEEGRLVRRRVTSALHSIERGYQYDPTGHLIARNDSDKGNWRYTYDPMGRIIESIDPLHHVRQHTYDPAGDLLSHLPDTQKGLRAATHQGRTYRYDAAGNLVERTVETQNLASQRAPSTRFQWDENNRLRTVRTPDDTVVRMAYDTIGRRHRKSVNGERTFFAWDGDALLAEWQDGQTAREYVYYPGTFEPLALIDSDGQLYYYHNDLNGLPAELTKPNGEPVWSATYDALGRVEKILVGEVTQPLRMQGQYWDEEIGLCYNRYRYFDPQICSFISQDPIGFAGGENVYAYAPNIWGWVDPLGLSCKAKERRFNSSDEAAHVALDRYNPLSIQENREFGGLIFKDNEGLYGHTRATRGGIDGVNPWKGKAIPSGTEEVGYWHTHGNYSKMENGKLIPTGEKATDWYDSDNFSPQDIKVANSQSKNKLEYRGYVGTPCGVFKGYNAKTGKQYTF